MLEDPKGSKAIRSSRTVLCCLATPNDKNITISAWFEIVHILDAYVCCKNKMVYICLYALHYLSKYFDSENKSFREFTPLGYQTWVFQRLGLFELSKLTQHPGGSDSKILLTYAALS